MKTKFLTLFIAFFIASIAYSQSGLNNYKYVIVPKTYDFLKENDQYQLNSLTKFLFEKYGFQTLFEGEDYPEDLTTNRCLALKSNVKKDSGLFKTKLTVQLKDCNDKLVFISEVGESREKEYKVAYNLALRDAFKSFETINYEYKPTGEVATSKKPDTAVKSEVTQEIQQLKQEIQELKKEKEAEVAEIKEEIVETPVKSETKPVKEVEQTSENIIEGSSNILYAQEIEQGFQLVDSSPKVVYRIKNTNLKDVFLVENTSAIIYKKGDDWILEFYSGNTLNQEILNIKF
ncbi:hypothetical protein L3X39_11005 [Sabulilitoribacter multivorans]|uniref:DUF4468 domain-containing protein n=1 Tax=Flaviramulus multivorans TaxID=1304750 RepID=A0ABS9IKP1_9FLAO|nr:hypothetical protein [Flaviramulus multivorans]MCF7561166.1 hypothetical protein [Flaviramulus multivorans]